MIFLPRDHWRGTNNTPRFRPVRHCKQDNDDRLYRKQFRYKKSSRGWN